MVICNHRIWLHVTAGMHGFMGAAKEMIYGTCFLVRFKTKGVKLEDGLDIKISVKIWPRGLTSAFCIACRYNITLPES